jgi:uncharacterized cupin superfamily protein
VAVCWDAAMRTFNVFDATIEINSSGPEGYHGGRNRFGPAIGAARIGATVYDLPPGQAVCPYHYESEEEWLLVLQGELTLRHPEGEEVLRPGDITAFPVGPAGAHKTTNNGTETARLLMFATSDPIGYAVYPDSNKISLWSDSSDPADRVLVRRGENLSYYDGEL